MRKILFLFLMATMFSIASYAQGTTETVKKNNPNAPVMKFEQTTMDYGTIMQDADPVRKFKFQNAGKEPLVISNARGSCGCTVPTYPTKPILPGESATIDVRYDTHRVGNFQKTVTLTTNTNEETIVLTIKGDVKEKPKEESVPQGTKSVFN